MSEAVLEPGLPIIDPHHHLWDGPQPRYLLDDLLADISAGGHDIRATVFVNCWAMLKADGPEELRPVGEVEFVNGVAAMSASGKYGPTRICAGIVGDADLRLGAAVERVLEAEERAGGGRFRGIRHILANDPQVKQLSPPQVMAATRLPRRLRPPAAARLHFRRLDVSPATARAGRPHGSLPGSPCGPQPRRRPPQRRHLRRRPGPRSAPNGYAT